MTRVFVVESSGFTPDIWPVIAFARRGDCEHLLENAASEDVVAFIGSRVVDTAIEEQGRLLGMVTFYREVSETRRCLGSDYGRFSDSIGRLPYCFRIRRAWRFTARPPVGAIIDANLSLESESCAVLLSELDSDSVLDLEREKTYVGSTVSSRW